MASTTSAEDLILYLYVDSILRTGIISDNLTSAKSNSELVRSLESLLEASLACPRHPSLPLLPLTPSPTSTSAPSSSSTNPPLAGIQGFSLTRPLPENDECEAVPSYSCFQSSSSSSTGKHLGNGTPPTTSTSENGAASSATIVTIPARDAIQQEPAVTFPETREALDVTAKFFYLPPAPSDDGKVSGDQEAHHPLTLDPAWISESLEQLRVATGLSDIDTFIISIPGLVFDEDLSAGCATDTDSRTNGEVKFNPSEDDLDTQITKVWRAASSNTHIKSLGVSEFSLARLRWLLEQGESAPAHANADKDGAAQTQTQTQTQTPTQKKLTTGITSSEFRKPRVGQINLRECCDVPADLVNFARKEDIELLVHSDCSDFLPPKTFTRLLARHGARLPPPLISPSPSASVEVNGKGPDDAEAAARRALESLSARWVLKYTVLIRDRALVADKGYIVKATRM